ncbi:FAD-dependent monooxygenase [Gordonia humi]|uniref:2-polyprenyl-6-methoxyphenol hydroxylase-like FAD-dependent oxidoreductase n=1 Tax=Gordonia humi TaxID=686429 RepID=A0A840F722_9ACTN|nr:2-polyprenyl-6-methoxyphenol hydroxylase-like FAD-dependent oxidoreductase [Gordonia humi]
MTGADHNDVIVIGGGPVGMLVANELALHGISALVLEQRGEVSEYPKAGTYHARAIATLARRGMITVPRVTTDHRQETVEPFQFAGYPWLSVRGRTIDGPVMLGIAQADLERAIARRAEASGARVLRRHKAISVEQDDEGVRVVAAGPDGVEQSFAAGYVVGADGGRSTVRRSGAFAVREYAPTMRAILGLAHVPHPEQLRPGWTPTPRGWTLLNLNRYGDSRLIVFEFDGPITDRAEPVTPEEFTAAVDRAAGSHVDLVEPHYLNRFSDYSRVVDNYRHGRLLLAGDAAHIHYPLGGQGLNTGINDAVNLGWKLAAVLTGAADERLLDTYGAEREAIGKWLIDNTRLQSTLMNPDPANEPLRNMVEKWLREPAAHDWLADQINGTSVRHPVHDGDARAHPLDGEFVPDFELGAIDGATLSVAELLQRGEFLVLARASVAQTVDEAVELPFSRIVAVSSGLPEEYPDVVLVRPDGYVAWAGGPDAIIEMTESVRRHFGLRAKVRTPAAIDV